MLDFHGIEQVIYEQGENYDNPLRCPVKLYEFYLSKWFVFLFFLNFSVLKLFILFYLISPENVKNRSDLFYLLPEKATLPTSPIWFSSQPLSIKTLDNILNRIKMVKEVNELLLAASAPSTSSTTTSA